MLRTKKTLFSPGEYLAMEEVAEYKSEYYAGEIFAMAGGTEDHSLIAVNLVAELRQALRSRPCRVFNSDMRLYIGANGLYTYPDAMVICGPSQLASGRKDTVMNPVLIVETLSESTRDYDLGPKFEFYKQIPGLKEYVVVESERAFVRCFRRASQSDWTAEDYNGLHAGAELLSISCRLMLGQVYDKISWVEAKHPSARASVIENA